MTPTTRSKVLRVRDVMTEDPVRVQASDDVREIARLLDVHEISAVPVVDAQDRVLGLVSKTDILHRCLEGPPGSRPSTFFERLAGGMTQGTDLDPEQLGVAEELMTTDLVTAVPDDRISAVARRMADACVHRAVVVDDERHLIGIVTAMDLLGEFP